MLPIKNRALWVTEMVWVFGSEKILVSLTASVTADLLVPQLSGSHHSVLFLCRRNILHDSHCRPGNWLRSGRSAAADIHRLPDCRSNRVSGNPIFRNILIAQLFNNIVSNIGVTQILKRGKYSCIARRQVFGKKKQPWYFVINTRVGRGRKRSTPVHNTSAPTTFKLDTNHQNLSCL